MKRSLHFSTAIPAFSILLGWLTAGCQLTPLKAQTPPADTQSITLKEANAVDAEFRVGAAGNIAVIFKFADGRTQTLSGVVKADAMIAKRWC